MRFRGYFTLDVVKANFMMTTNVHFRVEMISAGMCLYTKWCSKSITYKIIQTMEGFLNVLFKDGGTLNKVAEF